MNYILAIDQGTSSTRAIIYDLNGAIITGSQYPITSHFPQLHWVEQDPEEIWQKTLQAIKDVVAQVPMGSILTCGITNQRETTVIWNKKTGQCLGNAIVWQDRRTEEYCTKFSDQKQLIQDKTGLLVDPYFSASKLNWLLQHIPNAKELAAQDELAFGTMDCFLIWRLTEGNSHKTDVTNASRTMLFNIHTLEWDQELLQLFSIPESTLPNVVASDSNFGEISQKWFGMSLPITGVAGDQQAALIGQGCFQEGMVKTTFGTGAFLVLNTGDKSVSSKNKLLTTIAYQMRGKLAYALEGSIYHAGTTIKWLRDELKVINNANETETLAQSLPNNQGVYFVSSFTGLGAPHWSTTSGAMMIGISRTSTAAHFARAALEGVCYQTRDVLACMREDSHLDISLIRVDGGMAINHWFLQFLADQCKVTIQKPKDIETTAKGAALLAGIGFGLFESTDSINQFLQVDCEFEPQRTQDEVEKDYLGWRKALDMVL